MSRIILFGFYKKYTDGRQSFQIDDGPLVETVLSFTGQFPELKRALYRDDGALRGNIMFKVNGEYCRHSELVQKTLKDDSVEIHPILTGG